MCITRVPTEDFSNFVDINDVMTARIFRKRHRNERPTYVMGIPSKLTRGTCGKHCLRIRANNILIYYYFHRLVPQTDYHGRMYKI